MNDQIEFDIAEDEVQTEFNGVKNIYTSSSDPNVRGLHDEYKEGVLIIQPSYQREFVWELKISSKLIESVLLDIPLPTIYLNENEDGTRNVIDGQQRLTALFSFIDGQFPNKADFKLNGLEALFDLNGKLYKELPNEMQRKIKSYSIRTITFKKESDKDLQFEIFKRLNTGSMQLNDQELRNCAYRGKFNDLVIELSTDRDFMSLLGLESSDKRMKDKELVLRFCAFYINTYLKYKAPIKTFLNNTMRDYQSLSDDKVRELKEAFKNAVSITKSVFGGNSFKKFHMGSDNSPGHWETKKFNVSLFDVVMNVFADIDKNRAIRNAEGLREELISLMTSNQRFIDSILLSTSSVKAVEARFELWRESVKKVILVDEKQPRCFTYALKKQLFEANDVCAICNNRILLIDDSAVDHIQQYWLGGKTIPENARLTHRYCNNSRARNE